MSSQKLLDVGILGAAQFLICSAEDDFARTHHHHLTVD
jgi:hypothetical protein